ncbi:hypothetical protein JY461_12525 [Stenotrophomonas maltophilia]|nr:hypothetical protein [Stenotrophomonas maltophilia]
MWEKYLRVRAPLLVLVFYLFLSLGLLIWHLWSPFVGKWEPIVTGVIAGAFIAVLQFSWDWLDAKGVAKLKSLKVSNVLVTRDEEEYYRSKIEGSKRKIDLLGSTASRFLRDFADGSTTREDKKVLLRALERNVSVRILVAEEKFLPDDEARSQARLAKVRMKELGTKYSGFKVRYYSHSAAHSVFLVDDPCMVGPIFADRMSKDTPAIEMLVESPLVAVYLEHFEAEWKGGVSIGED